MNKFKNFLTKWYEIDKPHKMYTHSTIAMIGILIDIITNEEIIAVSTFGILACLMSVIDFIFIPNVVIENSLFIRNKKMLNANLLLASGVMAYCVYQILRYFI